MVRQKFWQIKQAVAFIKQLCYDTAGRRRRNDFHKIIPENRPLETLDWFCLTKEKIYPSLEAFFFLLKAHKIHIWEAIYIYGLCSLTEDQHLSKHLLTTSDHPVCDQKTFLVQYNSCDVEMYKRRSWSQQGGLPEEQIAGLKLAMLVRRTQFHPVTIIFSVFMSPWQTCYQTKTLLLLQRLHFNILASFFRFGTHKCCEYHAPCIQNTCFSWVKKGERSSLFPCPSCRS